MSREVEQAAAGLLAAARDLPTATEHVLERIRDRLQALIGADGYRVLLVRALETARESHPLLGGVEISADETPRPQGIRHSVGG